MRFVVVATGDESVHLRVDYVALGYNQDGMTPPAQFDWLGVVIVPIIITIVLGTPLAIYTGMVASRMFAFFQVRHRCIVGLFGLKSVFETREVLQPADFEFKFSSGLVPLISELRALGHEDAAQEIAFLRQDYLREMCTYCGVELQRDRSPDLPINYSALRCSRFQERISVFYAGSVLKQIAVVSAFKPTWEAIFSLSLFPNYIAPDGEFIGLAIRVPDETERIWAKINRAVVQDWKAPRREKK